MKTKLMVLPMFAAVVAFVGLNIFQSQKLVTASDLVLNNVEALAQSEVENYHRFVLKTEGSCNICRRDDGVCNVHDQVPC